MMALEKGGRAQRGARGVLAGALALVCGACGGSQSSPFFDAAGGTKTSAGAGGRTGVGGAGLGGSSSDRAGSDGTAGDAGADGDAGASSDGGSGQGGSGETGGDGPNQGGAGTGGSHSGGTGGMGLGGANLGGASCGDTVIGGAEECDDGNIKALDGCSATCKYEVVDRMTTISVQSTTAPSFCAPAANTLGHAFSTLALAQINSELQQSINNGVLNNLLQFSGLDDLTGGSADSSLTIGFLPAVPDPSKGTWPGGAPLDYWFKVLPSSVDAQGLPLNSLSGSVTTRTLSAGPGLLKLPIAIGGAPSTLAIANAKLSVTLDATPTPNPPAPPPAALAAGLKVFQSITGSGTGQGICGNVTVESLSRIPVPASLASGAANACEACTGSRAYTACAGNTVAPGCNSMLDLLVGGCRAAQCLVAIVTATQPDVPATGSASVRPLSLDAGNAVPSEQSTGNADAYSSYFRFNANRAHITGQQ
jgi:cysteine-rich repeat protein